MNRLLQRIFPIAKDPRMRTFLVFTFSFVVLCAAHGADNKTKTSAKTSQHSGTKTSQPVPTKTSQHATTKSPQHVPTKSSGEVPRQNQSPAGTGAHSRYMQTHQHAPATNNAARIPLGGHPPQNVQAAHLQHQGRGLNNASVVQPAPPPPTKEQLEEVYAQGQGFRSAEQFRKWQQTGRVDAPVSASGAQANQHGIAKPASGIYPVPRTPPTFTARHYDLPKTVVPHNEKATFQPGSHIPRCNEWHDSKYDVFRNYSSTWHDKNWWITHHRRIVFVYGGWYYWNTGYWYPAWGYHPDAV
jgi:hypothetical protein